MIPLNRDVSSGGLRVDLLVPAVTILLALATTGVRAQESARLPLPDNPLQGRVLFEDKHCNQCHPILDSGESLGPDLGAGRFSGSFFDMGSAMWNHVPGMSVRFEGTDLAWPQLTGDEVIELTSFLYYIDYLGRPGNPKAGQRMFTVKGCAACHSIGREGGKRGPDLGELEQFASPLYIAQAIWNHGPSMLASMQEMHMVQPRFDEGDLADLSAYLRQVSRNDQVSSVLLAPGNPNRGREVFTTKGCSTCHTVGGRDGHDGPDLSRVAVHRPAEAIAGIMWNHATSMIASMRERGVGWPTLTSAELADLVAFLYFLPFTNPPGDPERGEMVFRNRTCANCHTDSPVSGHRGPDLEDTEATRSPEGLVAAMWNHAPVMKEVILSEGRPWPELSGHELRDLFAYLKRTANAQPQGDSQ